MSQYQEIVTKAVIGKGRKSTSEEIIIKTSDIPSKVLGCWVINNHYSPSLEDNSVYVVGSYDVHIWYAYDDDSKTEIARYKQEYKDLIPFKMKNKEDLTSKVELKAYCPVYPTCNGMTLNGQDINIKVEKEFIVDAIGEAIIKVQVSHIVNDDWAIEDEIDKSVNVDYISK